MVGQEELEVLLNKMPDDIYNIFPESQEGASLKKA